MTNNTQVRPPSRDREFQLVVLGATGLTGALVVEQLVAVDEAEGTAPEGRRWAVAGRSPARLAALLDRLRLSDVQAITADLEDDDALAAMAARTTVVMNCAGPYTATAERVVGACVAAGTSYVDLSGEIPLLRRVIDRFDGPAREAGVQVVQLAGWEALPADLTTLLAGRRATAQPDAPGPDLGPGAADPVAAVTVNITFDRRPDVAKIPFQQSFSAGTLGSIVEMIEDPQAALIGRSGVLLPQAPGRDSTRFSVWRSRGAPTVDGRVVGPLIPVAFLNPPVVARTAALLAAEQGVAYRPATYREGVDLGPAAGLDGARRIVRALGQTAVQALVVAVAGSPTAVRARIAAGLRRLLPAAGSGPTGRYLTDWRWTVRAHATATDGRTGTATLTGQGHPGYTATAALLTEVGLRLAEEDPERRSGCLTPALAVGLVEDFRVPGLALR